MTTLAFDTHKAVKALREAGFEDAQAEAVIEQMRVAPGENMAMGENVATKDDLEKLELRMTLKMYAAVAAGVGMVKVLDFLIG